LQGIFLSIEASIHKRKNIFENKYSLKSNIPYVLVSIVITYVLFAVSQVFGRAATFQDSITVFDKVFFERGSLFLDKTTLAYAFIGVMLLILKDFRDEYFPGKLLFFRNKHIVIRFASYLFVTLLILWIGILNGGQFIYFQF